MIKIDLLNKKSICHALLSSTNDPNTLIPIKGVVEDIHFNEKIPFYDIKIIKFYDNIDFLKDHFFDKSFLRTYQKKPKYISIPKTIKNVADLENWFNENQSIRFCVESTFVTRTKNEMVEIYNKIQEYLIIQNLRLIRTSIMRPLYDGHLKINSKIEFKERLRRMIGDKMSEEEFNQLNDSI